MNTYVITEAQRNQIITAMQQLRDSGCRDDQSAAMNLLSWVYHLQPVSPTAIPLPRTEDMAAGMLNLGHAWLLQHAPQRLRDYPSRRNDVYDPEPEPVAVRLVDSMPSNATEGHSEHRVIWGRLADGSIFIVKSAASTYSYHDLHITTTNITRTSIFDLPYGYRVTCSRLTGWELQSVKGEAGQDHWQLVASEYGDNGLRLDIHGYVIVDSLIARRAVACRSTGRI